MSHSTSSELAGAQVGKTESNPASKSSSYLLAEAAWALAHQPAMLPIGNRHFSSNRRPVADFYFVAMTEALSTVIRRQVVFSWEQSRKSMLGAFGIVLAGAGARCLVTLDTDVCRALVESLTTDAAGLRGSGGLTDIESGLLEYVTLGVLDTISERYAQKDLRIEEFVSAAQLTSRVGMMKGGPLLGQLTTAGRSGSMGVWWESDVGRHPASRWCRPRAVETSSLPLRVGLPPIRISAAEFETMRSGDVLVMGSSVVRQPCRVVTDSGWSIASAVVAGWGVNCIRVGVGPLQPRPLDWAVTPSENKAAVVYPLAGHLEVDLFQFAEMFRRTPGQPLELDFPHSAESPATLQRGTTPVAAVDFLMIDGEWGLRLLERFADPPGTSDEP